MPLKIKNTITKTQHKQIKDRFAAFIKACGGASLVSKDTEVSFGHLRSTLGSKERLPSPNMILQLTQHFKDEVAEKFTREYLRPDVTPAQWRVLEEEQKKEPENEEVA